MVGVRLLPVGVGGYKQARKEAGMILMVMD